MSVNNFEENIQKELDALKLAPTAEVWEKVEAQIRKEKKRRFLILFFMSLLVFFAGGLFWLNGKDKQSATSIQSTDINKVVASKNGVVDVVQNFNAIKNNSTALKVQRGLKDIGIAKTVSNVKSKNRFKAQQQDAATGTDDSVNKLPKKRIVKGRIKFEFKAADIDDAVVKDENNEDSISNLVKTDSLEKSSVVNDSSSKTRILVIKDTAVTKSAAKQIVKNKTAISKWNFGFTFDVGLASTPNAYFDAVNQNNSLGGGGSGPVLSGAGIGGGSVNLISSPKPKASIGFEAGMFAVKRVSTKTNFLIGLNYSLLSTIIKNPNSGINPSSLLLLQGNQSPQSFQQYHNYFHFIEIPIEIQSRISDSKKLPLYWGAGIVLSQLIATNALQYNYHGVYYANNNLFNKTGIGLSASLFFSVGQNGKMPFQIGPDFYYSITHAANAGIYNQTHYTFAGIRLRKMLTKK